MSDHLPECERHQPYYFPDSVVCICDRLRACEARVRSAELAEAKALLASRDEAWESGVQAARDAVAGIPNRVEVFESVYVNRADALAAIDALRDAPHLDPCDCDDCKGKP